MATVTQAWEGIDLELDNGNGGNSGSSATIYYIVSEAADEATACNAAWAFAPAEYLEIPKKSAAMSERLSDTMWKVEIRYGSESSSGSSDSGDEDGEPRMSFDCSAGTKHVQVALGKNTVVYIDDQEEKTLYENAEIGWNGKIGDESSATGVDVPCANLRESYTKTMSSSKLSNAQKRKYAGLTGKVNGGAFMGWQKGEVMFMGCSYSAPVKGRDKVEVSFHFQIQLNETKAKLLDKTVSKEGYEYIWAVTKQVKTGDSVTTKPRAIIVSKVVEHANFSELGL